MQKAPVDEVVEVVETEGMVGVDRADEIRAADKVEVVIVDSTVTVTIAVALRANSPVASMTPENCILTEGYGFRYYV